MRVQLTRQDVHAHNLANAATPGFLRSDLTVGQRSFDRALSEARALPAAESKNRDISYAPLFA